MGVWGQAGAGKTFLGKHIHYEVVRHSSRFDGACWVTVSQEGTVCTIQTDIAYRTGFDKDEPCLLGRETEGGVAGQETPLHLG